MGLKILISTALGSMLGFLIIKVPGLIIGAFIGFFFATGLVKISSTQNRDKITIKVIDNIFIVLGLICRRCNIPQNDAVFNLIVVFDYLELNKNEYSKAQQAFNSSYNGYIASENVKKVFSNLIEEYPIIKKAYRECFILFFSHYKEYLKSPNDTMNFFLDILGISDNFKYEYNHEESYYQPYVKAELDPYKVLGLNPKCTNDEIKSKYKRLMMKYHPDKNSNKGLSPEMLKKIQEEAQVISEAYETLRNLRNFR